MKIELHALCQWLRENSSGNYGKCSDAADRIEELEQKLNYVIEYHTPYAACLCCMEFEVCEEDCTFSKDCPKEHAAMISARKFLSKLK